jgi:mRNA-degrading endonuclease RelE of RelBE toxin-antitoxin system
MISCKIMEVEVMGSLNFMETYNRLQNKLKKGLDDIMNLLKTENNKGDKIEKRLFLKSYERIYEINNLFRYQVGDHRLLYTILIQFNKKIYLLLDFLNHSDYDKLFGYNTS